MIKFIVLTDLLHAAVRHVIHILQKRLEIPGLPDCREGPVLVAEGQRRALLRVGAVLAPELDLVQELAQDGELVVGRARAEGDGRERDQGGAVLVGGNPGKRARAALWAINCLG